MQPAVAVVTGGSGVIGSAIAARLAAAGSDVCITYLHSEQKAQELVERLSAAPATTGRMLAVRADTGSDADAAALFATVDRELGRVTALVNNAGVLGDQRRVEDMDSNQLAALWATNITGYFLCAREAVRRMSTRRGGTGGAIVNVSSMAGGRGGSEQRVAYGASKGAVNAFTMGLGKEVALEGIRVNAVAPGYVGTVLHGAPDSEDRYQRLLQGVPMKRAGRPEEIAEAVWWLLQPNASFITGTLLNVAGGA
jgi:NAD(P)-dependent dehydrogenase (short-subunit alcohol dehydrogenase family)